MIHFHEPKIGESGILSRVWDLGRGLGSLGCTVMNFYGDILIRVMVTCHVLSVFFFFFLVMLEMRGKCAGGRKRGVDESIFLFKDGEKTKE